jgi:hypothetical protein
MSGKRQHFIPQFLQKGFTDRANGDKVWVYRKGVKPFDTNTLNSGVEGYFYSEDGDTQVDDAITEVEKRFSTLVDALRSNPEELTVDPLAIAETIAHFEIRTRHLRQSFYNTTEYMMEALFKFMDDPDTWGKFLRNRVPSLVRTRSIKEFEKRSIPQKMLKPFLILTEPLVEKEIRGIISNMPLFTNLARLMIKSEFQDTVKLGHIDGLKSTIVPQVKVDIYRNMRFSVQNTAELLPLGDSITVFQLSGERPFKPICEKDDPIEAVYLPLSPHQVLVGQFTDRAIDLSRLPMAIARCSLEFFISSSNSSSNEDLQSHIGECAYFLSEEQISNMLMELINEMTGVAK